jgi:hypothetical protein
MKLIYDPEGLEDGWIKYQSAIEAETAPIRRQLAIVEDGITSHKTKLAKLLDDYLDDILDRDLLIERQARLQAMVKSLTAQRDELQARLQSRAVTKSEFQSMQSFVGQLAERLDLGDYEGDIERMQQVIDVLDVRAKLTIEDGEQVLYLTCRIDSDRFIVKQTTCRPNRRGSRNPEPARR